MITRRQFLDDTNINYETRKLHICKTSSESILYQSKTWENKKRMRLNTCNIINLPSDCSYFCERINVSTKNAKSPKLRKFNFYTTISPSNRYTYKPTESSNNMSPCNLFGIRNKKRRSLEASSTLGYTDNYNNSLPSLLDTPLIYRKNYSASEFLKEYKPCTTETEKPVLLTTDFNSAINEGKDSAFIITWNFIFHLSLAKILNIIKCKYMELNANTVNMLINLKYSIKSFFRLLYKRCVDWCSIDHMIQLRILLLTVSFGMHYFILRMNVWDHDIFVKPPKHPSVELLRPNSNMEELEILSKFISLVHPHIDGHPHIHIPLAEYIRNGIAIMVFKWVILLWLSSAASYTKRVTFFGLITSFNLLLNLTGNIFGGLMFKTVLYPDIWIYIHHRIQLNQLNKTHLQIHDGSDNFFSVVNSLYIFKYCDTDEFLYNIIPYVLTMMFYIDVFGFITNLVAVYRFAKIRYFTVYSLMIASILLVGNYFLSGIPTPVANDHHWIDFKPHINVDFLISSKKELPVVISKYIQMVDGVELAADIYMPPNLVYNVLDFISEPAYKSMYEKYLKLPKRTSLRQKEPGHTTQSLLTITRYNRRMTIKWPFTMISLWGQPMGSSTANVWSWQLVDALVTNGYIVIVADTRGTGASFGYRPVDLSPTEFADFKFLKNWLSEQFWYDGKVATGGFSYDGMTGLHLAAMSDIKAVLALFTPVNVVHDLIQPGGIVCSAFVEDYTGLTMAFEKSGTPKKHMLLDFSYDWQLTSGFIFTFGIAAPVKSRESSLPIAIKQHSANWNMSHMVEFIHYTDDFVVFPHPSGKESIKIAVTQFGVPESIPTKIRNSDTSVYIVGGYCDASSVRGAARLFEALQNDNKTTANHKLIIGPWTHTGRQNCSPYSGGSHSHFEIEMYWDIIRFLDCSMRNKCWTLNNAAKSMIAPVHFWSVGEERWIASNEFPPRNVKELDLIFDATETKFEKPESYYDKKINHLKCKLDILKTSIYKNLIVSMNYFKKKTLLYILSQMIVDKCNLNPQNQSPNQAPLEYSYKLLSNLTHGAFENEEKYSNINYISYDVDYNATTRGLSRWVIAKHPFRMQSHSYRELKPKSINKRKEISLVLSQFFNYPYWSFSFGTSTGNMLMFSSSPLTRPLRVVGSPILRFSLNLNEELIQKAGDIRREFFNNQKKVQVNKLLPIPVMDVTVFAYLEDIDLVNNRVHYVTEGRILLSHRPTLALNKSQNISGLSNWASCTFPPLDADRLRPYDATLRQKSRIGSADIVYQTGDRLAHHFTIGGTECVVLSFEPIAWYFRPGHIIRLSLVGADRANFRWSHTQTKEDADLLDSSLLSAIKAGGGKEKLREVRGRGIHVEQPRTWNIPLHNQNHPSFLKLPILE